MFVLLCAVATGKNPPTVAATCGAQEDTVGRMVILTVVGGDAISATECGVALLQVELSKTTARFGHCLHCVSTSPVPISLGSPVCGGFR